MRTISKFITTLIATLTLTTSAWAGSITQSDAQQEINEAQRLISGLQSGSCPIADSWYNTALNQQENGDYNSSYLSALGAQSAAKVCGAK